MSERTHPKDAGISMEAAGEQAKSAMGGIQPIVGPARVERPNWEEHRRCPAVVGVTAVRRNGISTGPAAFPRIEASTLLLTG
jgi:hypothetical protein